MKFQTKQSEHWYDLLGNPVYEVERSNGKGKRPTNLADAKKLNLVPSVTGIIDLLAKPQLETWKQNNILEAACNNSMFNFDSSDEWKQSVIQEAQSVSFEAAKRGTEIHDQLERYFSGEKVKTMALPYISSAIEAVKEILATGWIPEQSFASILGYGGKIDLHHPDGYVIDFKTKEFTKKDIKKKQFVYDSHAMQLAAYRNGLGMPNATCINIFISINEPGTVHIHTWKEEEITRGWEMFHHLLELWKLIKKYELICKT